MKKLNYIALLPIGVFLVLYLGLGILFEYVMEIPMGFDNVPIVVAFLAAILTACLQNPKLHFDQKLEVMAQGVGDKNIITMLLIFLAAGSFVGIVGRSSAESVAYCMLSLIPARFSVAVLFVVACFVSVAMGTSVGTITLLVPIAAAVSKASGFDLPFCIGSVMGGAMFGDNLSFISDTTIAACNGQGCKMKDKFRENFGIAMPAAVATLIVILILSFQTTIKGHVSQPYNLIQVIPYVLVLIGGVVGINVFLVLLIGIGSGALIMLIGGYVEPVEMLVRMGNGVSGMFETCMVAILVAAMCALIREYGGFEALLGIIRKAFKGSGFFKFILFSPWITPTVAVSIVWTWIFNPDSGLANAVLKFFHLPALQWINSSQTALLSVIIVTVWKSLGYAMIFYLSALEKVPSELYEANGLDGANAWQRFRDVTLPCISPTTFFLLIVTMVNSLQAYDQIQILTQGGPSGSTRTLLYMYYQLGFEEYDMGQATAVAIVLIAITVLLSVVQFIISKKWVHY